MQRETARSMKRSFFVFGIQRPGSQISLPGHFLKNRRLCTQEIYPTSIVARRRAAPLAEHLLTR
jgi:hypothetical protein